MVKALLLVLATVISNVAFASQTVNGTLPDGFVYVDTIIPNIHENLRYYGSENFVGHRIDGYKANRAILTRQATLKLKDVQKSLNAFGLGIKIFDTYRPQQAVDNFVRWAKDVNDTKNKATYYPDVNKKDLFKEGYIASKSGHTRGSTVDLTIVNQKDGSALDMGSGFDYFGVESWPDYPKITAQQQANRLLLRSVMMQNGFVPYDKEWWHFTLKNEPYPNTYFNFPVQ